MSQDGLLLSSQCKMQASHLEVTEWDWYQPALDILAVFYMFIKEKKQRRRSEEGAGNLKVSWPLPCAFYENSEQMPLDSPLANETSAAIGYLWLSSREKTHAQPCTI